MWKIKTSSAEKRCAFLTVQCIFAFHCYLLSCLTSPAKWRLGAHGWWCPQHMAETHCATESTWAWESDGFTAGKWGTQHIQVDRRSCARARPGLLSPALVSKPYSGAEGYAFGGRSWQVLSGHPQPCPAFHRARTARGGSTCPCFQHRRG